MTDYEIGLLAYGSVINDPKFEILDNTLTIIQNVTTPFTVEFARSSTTTRCGAPTLIPYAQERRPGDVVALLL